MPIKSAKEKPHSNENVNLLIFNKMSNFQFNQMFFSSSSMLILTPDKVPLQAGKPYMKTYIEMKDQPMSSSGAKDCFQSGRKDFVR